MARAKINTDDIIAGAVTGAKIANTTITDANIAVGTITGTKIAATTVGDANISGMAANKLTTAIGNNNVGQFAIAWDKFYHTFAPNFLRNGGLDEDATATPVGWTDVSGGAATIATSGEGQATTWFTTRPQHGVGYSRKFTRASGSTDLPVLRQDNDLFAMGLRAVSSTNNLVAVFVSFHVRVSIPGQTFGLMKITMIENGSPGATISVRNNAQGYIDWDKVSVYLEPTTARASLTSLTCRVEVGVSSGCGVGDFVVVDSISACLWGVNAY